MALTNANLGHIQVNIDKANMPFYTDLAGLFGLQTLHADENALGVGGTNGASLWFIAASNGANNDYDGPGVNHIGISVNAIADVDAVAGWLGERGVESLFETPRHRPEFAGGEDQTYYQVMFRSSDNVLWEVVYTGPK